nr:MAG TPA: minor tail protein [Caudoviricetes sp.]
MDRIFSTSKEIGIAPSQDDLKYYDTLVSEIDRAKNNISGLNAEIQSLENSKNGMEDKANSIKNIRDASEKASKSIRKMGDSAKKSSEGFKVGLKTMLKYVFGVQSLIALINKLRSAMVEGLKNLAQFNDGVNPTNTALSNLKSALTQLKNSFAVAFAPILTVIEPILTRLISLLSTAMNYVGQFFAELTGASTFTKAIKAQENYAKSLNGTAAAAKKAKKSVYAFDELNTKDNGNTSSSGGSGSVNPNQMFEVTPIESKIAGLADKIKSIIDPIKESVQNWFANVNFDPLIDSFNKLKVAVQPIVDNIGNGLLWLFENVLEPLGSFVIEDALPAFFNLLASAVEACNKAFEVISPYLSEIWNEVFAPFAAFLGETFVGILNDVSQFFSDMGNMFVEKSEEIGTIFEFLKNVLNLVSITWKVCIQAMSGQLKPFLTMVKNIISHVIDILSGLIKFVTGVFTGNWKQAWEGVKDVLKGILNVIIDIVEGSINRIIGALNAISFDIPDFVLGIGGKHVGFNITPVSLPRLASGTVVPRQSREFAAILGDNNRETEVVSPLSTMKQAMIEALSESGFGGGNGDVYISADGDMDALIRLLKFKIERESNRVGRNFEKAVTV